MTEAVWRLCLRRINHLNSEHPVQHTTGQDRQPLKSTMFGAVCFAEVPDSVEAAPRFVPAAFLRYEYASRAPLVLFQTEKEDGTELKVFRAKSIKVPSKIVFAVDEDKQEIPLPMPKSGPPKAWLDKYGRTLNCYACGLVSLHGGVHSAECKRRYRTWVEQERHKQSESLSRELPAPLALKGDDGPSSRPDHPTGGRRATQKSPPVVSSRRSRG